MVEYRNGIGYGKHAVIYDQSLLPAAPAAKPIEETTILTLSAFAYVPWGPQNTDPIKMVEDIEGCDILNSIVNSQARLALGQGVLWGYTRRDKDGSLIVDDIPVIPEIDDFMEENNHYFQEHGWMKDLIGFNHQVMRFVLNKGKDKIVLFQRDDITELRYEKMNNMGIPENVYLCAQWEKAPTLSDPRVLKFPLLNPNYPLTDLRDKAPSASEFVMTNKAPTWHKKYYPRGDWQSSQDWIDINKKIPKMKAAMFTHNFRPRYQVTILQQFWENRYENDVNGKSWQDYTDAEKDAIRQSVYDDIDKHLGGVENHGKAVFVDGYYDQATGKTYSEIEIKPIDDAIKEGNMLPDSAAANSQIAFGMKYNPAIIGASLPSGPYTNAQGGSNVRESVTVQILIHEPERQMICRNYNLVKRFNGWDKTYPKPNLKLEPIIPTTILTTLDTGSGTSSGFNNGQPQNPSPNPNIAV